MSHINELIRDCNADQGFGRTIDIPLISFTDSAGDILTTISTPSRVRTVASGDQISWAAAATNLIIGSVAIPPEAALHNWRVSSNPKAYRIRARLRLFMSNQSGNSVNDGAIDITVAFRAARLTPPVRDAAGNIVTNGSFTSLSYANQVKPLIDPGAVNLVTKFDQLEFDLFNVDATSGSAVPLVLQPGDMLRFSIQPAAHPNNNLALYRAQLRLNVNAADTDPTTRES
jgi:hypothetical protein